MDALSVGALTLFVQAEAVVAQLEGAVYLDEVRMPSSRAALARELALVVEAGRALWTRRQEAEIDYKLACAGARRAADEVTAWSRLARSALTALAEQAPDQAFEARSLVVAMGEISRRVAPRLAWAQTFEPLMIARAAAVPSELASLADVLRGVSAVRAALEAALDAQEQATQARAVAAANATAAVERVREKVRRVWAWWRLAQLQRPGLPDLDLTYARARRGRGARQGLAVAGDAGSPGGTDAAEAPVTPAPPAPQELCPPGDGPVAVDASAVVTLGAVVTATVKVADPSAGS